MMLPTYLVSHGSTVFLFLLLWYHNRYINALEALGGSASLAEGLPTNTSLWDDALDALIIGINQVCFSGWKPNECSAIVNELLSWKQKGLSEFEGTTSPFIYVMHEYVSLLVCSLW
jgi:hypothetical protein